MALMLTPVYRLVTPCRRLGLAVLYAWGQTNLHEKRRGAGRLPMHTGGFQVSFCLSCLVCWSVGSKGVDYLFSSMFYSLGPFCVLQMLNTDYESFLSDSQLAEGERLA